MSARAPGSILAPSVELLQQLGVDDALGLPKPLRVTLEQVGEHLVDRGVHVFGHLGEQAPVARGARVEGLAGEDGA